MFLRGDGLEEEWKHGGKRSRARALRSGRGVMAVLEGFSGNRVSFLPRWQ
jgi:hypothetical protein